MGHVVLHAVLHALVVVWHGVHVVENPAAWCGGLVVALKSVWWQLMQVDGRFANWGCPALVGV